jgi:hypothetical protein
MDPDQPYVLVYLAMKPNRAVIHPQLSHAAMKSMVS